MVRGRQRLLAREGVAALARFTRVSHRCAAAGGPGCAISASRQRCWCVADAEPSRVSSIIADRRARRSVSRRVPWRTRLPGGVTAASATARAAARAAALAAAQRATRTAVAAGLSFGSQRRLRDTALVRRLLGRLGWCATAVQPRRRRARRGTAREPPGRAGLQRQQGPRGDGSGALPGLQ